MKISANTVILPVFSPLLALNKSLKQSPKTITLQMPNPKSKNVCMEGKIIFDYFSFNLQLYS